MSLFNSLDRARHFGEFNSPLPSARGVLTPETRKAEAMANLMGSATSVPLPQYTVATAPAATGLEGHIIYVSDGAAGSSIIAFSDGTDWLRSDDGTAISTP